MPQTLKGAVALAKQCFASPGTTVSTESYAVERQAVDVAFESILKGNRHRVGVVMLDFEQGNLSLGGDFSSQTRSVKIRVQIAGYGLCRVCFQNVFKVQKSILERLAGGDIFGVADVGCDEHFLSASERGGCFK